MDDGLARVEDVMSSQRATPSTGGRNIQVIGEEPPPRGALFFCNFSFGQAKEKLIQRRKKFLRQSATTRRVSLTQERQKFLSRSQASIVFSLLLKDVRRK